jgi:predicted nucleotidyltransferase
LNVGVRPELKSSVEAAVAELKAAGAQEVYAFGSGLLETGAPPHDLDLAVSGLPAERFFPILGRLLCLLDHPVDLINLDRSTPFTRYLRDNGELVRVG